jgi:hypothetical protein
MLGNNEIRMSNDEEQMDGERTVCPPRAGRGKLAITRCDREINGDSGDLKISKLFFG